MFEFMIPRQKTLKPYPELVELSKPGYGTRKWGVCGCAEWTRVSA